MSDDVQRLWMEVALRDLTGPGKDAIVRNTLEIKNATIEAARAAGELGGGGIGKEVAQIGNALGGVAKIAAGVFTGIKAADAVRDLSAFHATTMATAAGLPSLASRLTITTDELQAYQGAARGANVTNDELNKTLFTFNQTVGQAKNGNKAALEAFEKLGIKILDAQGNLRPMPELLNETSRSLLMVENGSVRASIGAALLGEKGARLNPLLRELEQPIAALVDRSKSFGEIIDREVVEKLDRAKNASEASKQQFTALYATVAAPLQTAGMENLARLAADITRAFREANAEGSSLITKLNAIDMGGSIARRERRMGGPPDQIQAKQAEDIRTTIVELERYRTAAEAANKPAMVESLTKSIDEQRVMLGKLEAAERAVGQAAINAAAAQRMLGEGLPAQDAFKSDGVKNPPPTKSGAGTRDRIGESLNELKGQVAAAQMAWDQLQSGAKVPLDDLEREVALRKKIADEIAKLGKYDPKDPRVEQLKEQIRLHEEIESKIKTKDAAMRDAIEIESRMGNGQAFMAAESKRLNEALDTGRLSYEGYSAAMRTASEQAEDMRLKLAGTQGGVEGLVAGMQYASAQWQRSNSAFAQGGQLFQGVMSGMEQGITQFAQTGQLNFNNLLQSFLMTMAQMEARSAMSSLWSFLGGSGGGGGGGIISGLLGSVFSGGGGGSFASIGDLIGTLGLPGFAGGGDPPIGMPFLVGEYGPEVMISKVPTTVYNRQQLSQMGGGESPTVIVQQTIQLGSIVSQAQHEQDLMRVEKHAREGAIAGVAEAVSRGGSYRRSMQH